MKTALRLIALASLSTLPLAACNESIPAPQAAATPSTVTPASFRMPEGSGCKGEVDRFRAVMDNDQQMGQVNASVYKKVSAEIDQASAACAAGKDGQAVAMINASKARHGYR